jgi:predicted nucleic acid-binding protein
VIYIDTSALIKLIVEETESSALIEWVEMRKEEPFVTSALGRVELMRTAARDGTPGIIERALHLLDGLDILPITEKVIALAETIGPTTLRSLDAIHLASATQIRSELTALVAYDVRLLEGCRSIDLPTAAPTSA